MISVRRKSTLVLLVVLMFGPLGFASLGAFDDPYGKVVKQLEREHNAKRTKIPFLRLGNFVLKFWHPAGVKNVKVALFQNQGLYDEAGGKLDSIIKKAAPSDWHPLIREFSREDNHWTYVYYADPQKDTRVLVVSVDRQNAVVAQVKFEPAKLLEFIQNPALGRALAGDIWRETGQSGGSYARDQGAPGADETAPDLPAATDPGAGRVAPSLKERPILRPADKPDSLKYREVPTPDSEVNADKAIKLEARLVNLNVSAIDRTGRAVSGLNKENFSILEDGKRQEIVFFGANSTPLTVMVLLDLSGSTKDKIKLMRKAASKFVDSFSPADRIAVASFTRRFQLVSDFTSDHKFLKARIDAMKNRGGGTAYYDAMWAALDRLDRAGNNRKALVVITDGVDNYIQNPKIWRTVHTFQDLLDRAVEDDVTVYPIYLDTEAQEAKRFGRDAHRQYEIARHQVLAIAEESGGVVVPAAEDKQLEAAYRTVAAELRTLYSLAYAPTDLKRDGKWRQIQVRVDRPEVTIKARRGFTDK